MAVDEVLDVDAFAEATVWKEWFVVVLAESTSSSESSKFAEYSLARICGNQGMSATGIVNVGNGSSMSVNNGNRQECRRRIVSECLVVECQRRREGSSVNVWWLLNSMECRLRVFAF